MNENEISRITTTLGEEKDAYYVYMLCKNVNGVNKPFYIGKGIRDRVLQHEAAAEKEIEDRQREISELLSLDKKLSNDERISEEKKMFGMIKEEISEKYKKINELGADNVVKVIVKWGLTESEAFMAESALINAYAFTNGRSSLTNVVNGHMSEREKASVSCSTKARTLQEFLDECAAAEKCVTDLKEPAVFLKINNLYPQCMQLSVSEQEEAIYESCRACWKLNKDKVKKIKYVFAIYNSQVVGIYSVNENSWKRRSEIDDSFPTFPQDTRLPEIKYANIAKTCDTLSEMRTRCDNYDEFLKISEMKEANDANFNGWKNRYYFNRTDDEIPDDVLAFKNCILVKPNGDKFFSGRGTQSEKMYNFDVKKGDVIIKTDH